MVRHRLTGRAAVADGVNALRCTRVGDVNLRTGLVADTNGTLDGDRLDSDGTVGALCVDVGITADLVEVALDDRFVE